MRILMLNHEYPPVGGGSGVALQHLAHGLVQHGETVRVVTLGSQKGVESDNGVEVVRFVSGNRGRLAGIKTWGEFLLRAPKLLCDSVVEFQPDVINSHFIFPSGHVVARSGLKTPHVLSVVGADIHDPTRRISADRNWLVRRLCGRAISGGFAVSTPSNDLTERTRSLFPGANVQTIPWGVPRLDPANVSRQDLGLSDETLVVSTLCRLVRRKRIDSIVEALGQLSDCSIKFVIMGAGPEESSLRRQAERFGVAGQIEFTGKVTDEAKAAWLHASDVFCLASEHEGFGLVYLEAMGLSTAVIAGDVGGQKDIIRNGVDGYLVPIGDTAAIADRIRSLAQNRRLLHKMKVNANLRANDFLPEQTVAQFHNLFEAAISPN